MQLTVDLPKKASDTLLPKARYKVLYGGRDGGKSHSVARYLLVRGYAKPERILCTREIQKSIAESVHKLLSDLIEDMGLGDFYEIQNNYIYGKNGTQISFHGLSGQTATSIKSFEGTTICWIEEAQTVTKKSLDILVPTIRAPGSEIIVSFNPDMDTDEVYKRFVTNTPPDCICTKINYYDNPWRSKALDSEREHMRLTAPDDFAHIYEGNCRPAVEGAIYYNEVSRVRSENRLCNVPYDPLLKVHAVFDLGWNDKMSIGLVQRKGSEIRIIRYIEDSFITLADFDAELRTYGYNYGTFYLPHDGRAKDYRSGKSAEEILKQLGRQVEIVENIGVEDGIKAARLIFPRAYFDQNNASQLLNRLGRYRRRVAPNGTAMAPVHDDESHGADMFRYLAIVADQMSNDSLSIAVGFTRFMTRG